MSSTAEPAKPAPAQASASPASPPRGNDGPAVRFLTDEKVKSAPMAKKIAFLESKGLTSQEIDVAVARASGGAAVAGAAVVAPPVPVPTYAPVAPVVPAPAPWTAKDVVVTAAAIALHTAATDAQKALADATSMVTERDAQLAAVVKDMAELRDQVPKMVDQARDAQLAALSDLQNEIRSLRMAVVASSATPNGPSAASDTAGQAAFTSSTAAVPRTLVATPPPSLAVGPPKIPDWQVKAAKKAKATVQATSPPMSSSGNGKADLDANASSSSASAASSTPSSPVKESSESSSPVSAAN
ncbi:peroxisomal membrane anchor protein conserved region-domain-containing protein [Catenaria anguillulae PL171]|uniref:Peroxisomal membrane protein PEX14 n=1 Tax=Catenaria anguillulae PL171 TaxID=765915 RepID=A0A1Y2I0I1_9FUNG|nr:peroxisomal membrane anchor protein conserved region-domain-containing protein [Catenaria anguillulae PL171]